jgi:hypothetical protein
MLKETYWWFILKAATKAIPNSMTAAACKMNDVGNQIIGDRINEKKQHWLIEIEATTITYINYVESDLPMIIFDGCC